jgi:DNA-binding XRE family transcriptional regulator
MRSDLAARVQKYRNRCPYSDSQLAALIGIIPETLYTALNGGHTLLRSTEKKIEAFLADPVSELQGAQPCPFCGSRFIGDEGIKLR